MSIWKLLIFITVLSLLFSGCSVVENTPLPAPTQESETNTPTNTPPLPNPTITQTPTITATPAVMSLIAELPGTNGPVYSLKWSADGNTIISGGYKQVNVWDVDSSTLIRTLNDPTNYIWGVTWSPDGTRFASTGQEGIIHVWKFPSLELEKALQDEWNYSIGFSPDGKYLASGTSHGRLTVWDVETGEALLVMDKSTKSYEWSEMISLDWSPDGKRIACGYFNSDIIIWDAVTGERLNTITDYVYHRADTNGIKWSPDGKFIVSLHQDTKIRVWETANFTPVTELWGKYGWMRGVAFSPDGKRLATTEEDHIVRVWDVATWSLLSEGSYGHGKSAIWTVDWSPDGKMLAIGEGIYGVPQNISTIYVLGVP